VPAERDVKSRGGAAASGAVKIISVGTAMALIEVRKLERRPND
jgi:hypothetical protein